MPAVTLLIKPSSSACNLNCEYCFYRDVSSHSEQAFKGMMSLETAEKIVRSAMEYAEGLCIFAFQGGEPTLAGLDFYRKFVELETKFKKPGVKVENAIQTNGVLIDNEWAEFLAENGFLVGVSLDGPAELHDINRKSAASKGSFNQVMRGIASLKKHGVEFNVLCVVTEQNARSVQRIYNFYKKQQFGWLQFIPCLDPLGEEKGEQRYSLSVKEYADFLVRLFDLWYRDFTAGEYVSIRHLDNWLSMLLGNRPEACNMKGSCSVQFVIEGNGSIYPCDFYVLDELCLGTVGEVSLTEARDCSRAKAFIDSSMRKPKKCESCFAYPICRNGCRRERAILQDGAAGLNLYCEAYRSFFEKRGEQLKTAAAIIRSSK